MGKNVKVDIRQLDAFRKQLEQLRDNQAEQFITSCVKELAARLLAKVIKRTPVGDYPKSTGKKGGTLRRGWTAKTEAETTSGGSSDAVAYAESLKIQKVGDTYQVEIINPVNYASYVEFGHRTSNHKGWVEGRFMLTISEQELEADAPRVIENKLKKYMGECFK
ncbi:MAG: HK97 gp10 family phage protein [Oscillospiraceae bacterium]|nr:HK97 gp10 family phage protein [Oscillospiraceae bacterium]